MCKLNHFQAPEEKPKKKKMNKVKLGTMPLGIRSLNKPRKRKITNFFGDVAVEEPGLMPELDYSSDDVYKPVRQIKHFKHNYDNFI